MSTYSTLSICTVQVSDRVPVTQSGDGGLYAECSSERLVILYPRLSLIISRFSITKPCFPTSQCFKYGTVILTLEAFLIVFRRFIPRCKDQSDAQLAWHPVNGAELEVVVDSDPVSPALPNSLQVTIPSNTTGAVGVGNEGYWGSPSSS